MSPRISDRDWVEYSIGNVKLKGFVEDTGGRIYWFSDPDILVGDGRSLIVDDTEIRVLPLEIHKEDIEAMIDLALYTRDEGWFIELSSKLEIMRMSFPEFLNCLDGDAIASDWDSVGKHKFNKDE